MDNGKINLLIIDDHEIVSDGYKNLLEAEGFNVLGCANNANDGYMLYKKLRPDVCLVDISMPGKSGFSCIETIIKFDPMARIIVCTMFDETQIAAQVIRCGAKGFITKANSLSIMVEAINKVYSGNYYLGEKYAQRIALMGIDNKDDWESPEPFTQLDTLTAKEFSIFKLVSEGRKTTEIADEMCLSPKTIANYRSRILRKLRVKNTRELMLIAIKKGVVKAIQDV